MSLPGLSAMGVGAVVASGSGSGGGGGSVAITDMAINSMGAGSQTVSYRLNTSGVVERGRNGVYNTLETWKLSGSSSDYEARVTETGGSGLTGGSATSTWLGLGTSREWELTETIAGWSSTTYFTVEIRIAAPPNTVLDSAAIEANAIVF